MDHTFTFSISGIVLFCGGVITVSGAIGIVLNLINKAKEPNIKQDQRIETLEKRINKFEEFLANDKAKIESIEEGNKLVQQALLGLMSHAINGNDIDKLVKARDSLENYLVSK